jgi:ligand-binding SRPBCC domain-containing protein
VRGMVRLEEVTVIHAPMERCFDLARSVEVHLKGNRHWGEEAVALDGVTSGLIGLGERVTWRARHFGVRQTLTSEITAMEAPRYFQDRMIKGVFRSMEHDHFFQMLEDGSTEMKDVFCFAAPLGVLGRVAEELLLRRYMSALLRERNAIVKQVAESSDWRQYLPSD